MFSPWGKWEDFVNTVNIQGFAWKNLLGQDKGALDLTRVGQIRFPATQIASSDANTLDDYEEGTWTPGFAFGGGTTGITYTLFAGYYTKIGRLVVCGMNLALSAKGTSTGAATITGLPFTPGQNVNLYSNAVRWSSMTSSLLSCIAQPTNSATTATLYGQAAGATSSTALTDADFADTTSIIGSFAFHV